MKTFNVPEFYRSPIISRVKQYRKVQDPRKKDTSPTVLDFGSVKYYIARHFGFCFGVENAIEISFKALDENPTKRIFLLSVINPLFPNISILIFLPFSIRAKSYILVWYVAQLWSFIWIL